MTTPIYCPFYGTRPGECRWSYDSNGQTGQRYLETHLKVNHKGQAAVPKAELAPPPRRSASARVDRDAREVAAITASAEEKRARKRPQTTPVTSEEAIAALKAAAAELGHSPSSSWWANNNRRPSLATIYGLFGKWATALEAAGLEPTRRGVNPATVKDSEPTEPAPVEAAPPVPPTPAAAVSRQAVRTSDLISFLLQRSSVVEIREMRNDAIDRVAQHKLIAEQAQAEVDLLDLALERLAA